MDTHGEYETQGVNDELQGLRNAIFDGDAQRATEITEQVLKLGYSTETIVKQALLPPMGVLGEKLRDGAIFIPEVLMSARAMQGAMYVLTPLMTRGQSPVYGTVVIGTVAGDYHDIGKNMVSLMLQAKGFSVIDLGIDVTAEVFADAVRQYKPDIVGISALLTTTMSEMRTVIETLVAEGLRSQVTVMVGGAPVSRSFAREIKADIYAETLFEAGEAAEDIANHRVSKHAV